MRVVWFVTPSSLAMHARAALTRWLLSRTLSRGAVREVEDDVWGDVAAPSIEAYLENFRNDLLGGGFEYIEDCGVVEKVGGGSVPTGK